MSAPLGDDERALVDVSAALASRDRPAISRALERALEVDLEGDAVEETLLQAYLFLGYPAALEGLALWRRVSGREAAPPREEDPDGWPARGEEICRRVYGGQYERLREGVRGLHPELERWMVTEGYGKVLGRPGLALRARELCIVALLAVLGAPRQLHSHLRGALNVGASEEQIEEALARALRLAREEEAALARETWLEVLTRWRAKAGDGTGERVEVRAHTGKEGTGE